jgi:hypothetical protein
MLEFLGEGLAAIQVYRQARSDTVAVTIAPAPIPVGLDMKRLLTWKKNADRGHPIPHEVEFLDTSGRVTGRLIVDRPVPRESVPKRRPGAPRKLTLEQFKNHVRRFPQALSDRQRAWRLSNELGTTISRSVVLRLRQQLDKESRRRRKI